MREFSQTQPTYFALQVASCATARPYLARRPSHYSRALLRLPKAQFEHSAGICRQHLLPPVNVLARILWDILVTPELLCGLIWEKNWRLYCLPIALSPAMAHITSPQKFR